MSVRDEGGPAFPVIAENGLGHVADGMTLRDWFAGQVAAAVVGGLTAASISTSEDDVTAVAKAAYRVADAMLAERSKQ